MVKVTDFKFDVHVPRDSPDMNPYKISELQSHVTPKIYLADICTLWAPSIVHICNAYY